MVESSTLVFGFFCLYVLTVPMALSLESKVIKLKPFSAINDCLPFNLKVAPSGNGDVYALEIEAEEAVGKAIDPTVRDGVLNLGLKNGFETQRAVKVTVKLPKDALKKITKSSTAILVVAPGMKLKTLEIKASGVAGVRVFDASIDDLAVVAEGTSVVFAGGNIKSARFDISGTAKAHCYGVTSKANATVKQVGKVYIQAANRDVKVTGRLDAMGNVCLTQGQCSIQPTMFSPGCERVSNSALPVFDALFSCGLIVDGKVSCTGGGSATSVVGGNPGAATATATGRGSTAVARSGTTITVGPSSTVSVGGMTIRGTQGGSRTVALGADAAAVAATTCLDRDLKMFTDE